MFCLAIISRQGPAVERFEASLAERVCARYAVAVANGTAALHLACLAGNITLGDVGLTSAVTFTASSNCLRYVGAEAGFVDIDRVTLGMSLSALAPAMGATNAKVVIPVHFGGLPHALAEIRSLTKERLVIEDAAQSLGANYECGRPVGCCAYSDMTIISFHAVKSITTGEGGVILTNDSQLAKRLRMLRSHGIERDITCFVSADAPTDRSSMPWYYEQQLLGYNYRMTDIQAALGCSQLAKLEGFISRRRQIARRYDEAFARIPGVQVLQGGAHERARSAQHLYVLGFDFAALRTTRGRLMLKLRNQLIGSQVHYIPLYRHPYYKERYNIDPSAFPEAEGYYQRCLTIPLYPSMTDEEVERVISAVMQATVEP